MCKSKWDKMLDKKIINSYDKGILIYSKDEPYFSISKNNLISRISKDLKIKKYYVEKVLEKNND